MHRHNGLKLMAILAHPDDESLGMGGTLATYAAEGIETYLVTATRGERGWFGPPDENPGMAELGRIREAELRDAARVLGVRRIDMLDYRDGDLDQADPTEAIHEIVTRLREIRPQVVVTFGPEGAYGHPDHIAISQFTTAAIVAAATADVVPAGSQPHQVSKLYYMAFNERNLTTYQQVFGEISMKIDGVVRRETAWPDWAITTRLDARACWRQVWQAITCHRTQLPGLEGLLNVPESIHEQLWGTQTFYRVFSLVNGGRAIENDLFAGLRDGQRMVLSPDASAVPSRAGFSPGQD